MFINALKNVLNLKPEGYNLKVQMCVIPKPIDRVDCVERSGSP